MLIKSIKRYLQGWLFYFYMTLFKVKKYLRNYYIK
jgi:hypothetical protein